jgi:hypothetical protein
MQTIHIDDLIASPAGILRATSMTLAYIRAAYEAAYTASSVAVFSCLGIDNPVSTRDSGAISVACYGVDTTSIALFSTVRIEEIISTFGYGAVLVTGLGIHATLVALLDFSIPDSISALGYRAIAITCGRISVAIWIIYGFTELFSVEVDDAISTFGERAIIVT